MKRILSIVALLLMGLVAEPVALAQAPKPGPRPAPPATPPKPSASPDTSADPAPYPARDSAEGSAEATPENVWDSPEMLRARNYILDYSRRSVQFGPSQARQYLARLEKLPPEHQRTWLQQFQARQDQIARSQAAARMARQQAVSNALDRIQTRQDAFSSISENQNIAADIARDRLRGQQDLAGVLLSTKRAVRGDSVDLLLTQRFNPFDPTLDPAGRSFRVRRAGAAATLPGDLVDANGNNIVGTDADIAAATPEGAAGYAGGVVPGANAGLTPNPGGGSPPSGGGGEGGGSGSP